MIYSVRFTVTLVSLLANLVLAFALVGLLFDGLSILSFGIWADTAYTHDDERDTQMEGAIEDSLPNMSSFELTSNIKDDDDAREVELQVAASTVGKSGSGEDLIEERGDNSQGPHLHVRGGELHGVRANMNILSALLHVGSDLLRSATTLFEAIYILNNPRCAMKLSNPSYVSLHCYFFT